MSTRISPRSVDVWIQGSVDDICGNYEIVKEFKARMELLKPEDEANIALIGDPGTGKTASVLCYLRQRLKDPKLGYTDQAGLFAELAGKPYSFIRINGT